LILSGGRTAPNHALSEARAMRTVIADSLNCCYDNIILEEASTNTIENAINCLPILASHGKNCRMTIHLVTSDFHIARSSIIFNHILKPSFTNINIVTYNSVSYYKQRMRPRPLSCRPEKRDDWYMSEVLEIEVNGTKALNEDLARYRISSISESYLHQTLKLISASIKKNYFACPLSAFFDFIKETIRVSFL
jgi:hypothetical protein